MNNRQSFSSRPPAPHLTRRTLARGAVWAVPVVSAATATPALAASGSSGPLDITSQYVRWSSGQNTSNSDLVLGFYFDNSSGTDDAVLNTAQVFTTYHSPATNGGGASQLVQTTDLTSYTVEAGSLLGVGFSMIHQGVHTVLPRNSKNKDITLTYYNGSTQKPPCVDGAYHGETAYPSVCRQLVDSDRTYVVFTYTTGGTAYAQTLTLDTAWCAVDFLCAG